MLIYLDSCCINRLFDDPAQERVRLEAEAVERILELVEKTVWSWLSSEGLSIEVGRTLDVVRAADLRSLLMFANQTVTINEDIERRAIALYALGFGKFDALHLACAEAGGATVFLTTDDKLLRRGQRLAAELRVRVENPVNWLKEVNYGREDNDTRGNSATRA